MSIKAIIKQNILPIEKYSFDKFSKDNAALFIGSPIKHPYEDDKFILICEPLTDNTKFIEFQKKDLVCIEEVSAISSDEGENVTISKVWIKLGAHALRYEPFIVTKTKDALSNKIQWLNSNQKSE